MPNKHQLAHFTALVTTGTPRRTPQPGTRAQAVNDTHQAHAATAYCHDSMWRRVDALLDALDVDAVPDDVRGRWIARLIPVLALVAFMLTMGSAVVLAAIA